jgi:murein DD-endopeptidase MepM/ murein hydrolase activator NlpD
MATLAVFAVFCVLMLSGAGPGAQQASSKSVKELERQKKSNTAQLSRIRSELKKLRSRKGDMAKIVAQVDREMDQSMNRLSQIRREEETIKAQHERLVEELGIASVDFRDHRDRYRTRLVAYYKTGDVSYLEILLQSDTFSDFISRMHYLRVLANRDRAMMLELRAKRDSLDLKKAVVAKKRQEVAVNREMQELEAAQIAAIQAEKRKQLKALEKDEEALARQEQILERETSRIEKQIDQMIAEAMRNSGGGKNLAPTFNGSFGNPICNGSWRVTSGWGPRKSPTRGASSWHKGIDLSAGYGQSICSVAGGTVIFVGRKGGYGKTVMVAHSRDLVTLYAHGKGFPSGISTGATVRKGQVVLYADSSGVSTGNHLHFSVFKNNTAVNPMNYF